MIDCDIHNQVSSLAELEPYLSDFWCDYIHESAFVGPDANDYPPNSPLTARPEAKGYGALSATEQVEMVRNLVLDPSAVETAILTCIYRVQSVHHPDLAAALATAVNHWQLEHWLDADSRLRASLVVPSQLPHMAVREIEQFGGHPGFVQIMLPVRSEAPYGNRRYDPIFEAAVKQDLAVAIHYGGAPGHPPTPSGWPTTFFEEYAGMIQIFQSQVISLITEGAFDRFPDLRIVLVEGGFSWLPSLMWRLDKEWKGLRHNIPWVKQPPSDYMRQHIRLTTAPMDGPSEPAQLLEIIEQMESDEMLMYASDFPHSHADGPMDIITSDMPSGLHKKIESDNARRFYRL